MSADVTARIDAVVASTHALQHSLESLTDEQCREPSLLPDWTRGHVLTHLARNADALRNLVHWARTGEKTRMYPSREARSADIEAGSGRSADELRADTLADERAPGAPAFPVPRPVPLVAVQVEDLHRATLPGSSRDVRAHSGTRVGPHRVTVPATVVRAGETVHLR